jgi:hypothetical protein
VALHQRGGQQRALQQRARAVQVGHHGVEQARALAHPGLDLRPVLRAHDQRQQVQRPGPLQARRGVGIDVVGHAVVAQLALQVVVAACEVVLAQIGKKARPGRVKAARGLLCGGVGGRIGRGGAEQFVEVARRGRGAVQWQRSGVEAGQGNGGGGHGGRVCPLGARIRAAAG